MEVDKHVKFKSPKRMQVEFISNNIDVMTHDRLSSVALALVATTDEPQNEERMTRQIKIFTVLNFYKTRFLIKILRN